MKDSRCCESDEGNAFSWHKRAFSDALPRHAKVHGYVQSMSWTGSILLSDDVVLQGNHYLACDKHLLTIAPDIRLITDRHSSGTPIPAGASLQLLSIVETAAIPFCMVVGSPCRVVTSHDETERWFSQIFASAGSKDDNAWWENARLDSPLGVLVGVEHAVSASENVKGPRATEVLFYASRAQTGGRRPPTPLPSSPHAVDTARKDVSTLSVHALLLSSDLLHAAEAAAPTPPTSPSPADEDIEAVFLSQIFPPEDEPTNEPPVRKRKSAADAFDEASERRKKARRRGGEGVIAAAAPKSESQLPSLKHRRSVSNPQSAPLQTRPLSRSPSIASSRPPTAVPPASKKSSLSQVQNTVEPNATEVKNKDFLSRTVMAGMRLYGLSQTKSRGKPKADSTAPSPAMDISFADLEVERKSDEGIKLIYHQVYKGTCFAFRASIGAQMLQPFAEQVRETVDKLLAIFCSDPLAVGLPGSVDEVTPGGRKAFGSTKRIEGEKSPFLPVTGLAVGVGTPTMRREKPTNG